MALLMVAVAAYTRTMIKAEIWNLKKT